MDSFVTSDTITTFSYTPVGLRAIRLLASKIAANSVSLHSVKTEQTVIDFFADKLSVFSSGLFWESSILRPARICFVCLCLA